MSLIRYNPWQEINALQRQLNNLFDDTLTPDKWEDFGNLSKIPAAELTETDDALHLKLEVPGMKASDLDVQVMVDRVAVSLTRVRSNAGERKSEITEKTRSEFRYGAFRRVIPLPVRIQNTNVKAEYKNGILHLTLPKAEE